MEEVSNGNDIQLPKFDFDKPIKVSVIFEDSDETDAYDNSELAESNKQYSLPQNNKKTNSATKHNASLPDRNFYSNVSFNDMEISSNNNIELENNCSAEVQTPGTVNATAISNLTINSLSSNENAEQMDFLDCISENMILITKYHHYYSFRYIAKEKEAKQHYLLHKYSYYEQSYNAILAALLPQEHNYAFIKNFVKNTIEIAKRKSWYHAMEFNTIEGLVLDMIQWAKEKKKRNNHPQCPMSRPSEISVPSPPPYSTSNVVNLLPINIQVPVSLGRQAHSASYSNPNEKRQPMELPVSFAQSNESPMQTISHSVSSANKQQPKNVQAPVLLRKSVPPLPLVPSTISNNTWQHGIPVTFTTNECPLQPPSYAESCNNIQQPTNMQNMHSISTSTNCNMFNYSTQPGNTPSVSFASSNMHMQRLYNMCYNTGQPMSRTSQILQSPTVTSLPHNNNACMQLSNHHQFQSTNGPRPSPYLTVPSTNRNLEMPVPYYSNVNINSRQPTSIPPQISHRPSLTTWPGTTHNIPKENSKQHMTSIPVPPVLSNGTNTDINKDSSANQDTSICLFSTGSPGSEISIRIDSKIASEAKSNNSGKKVCKVAQNRSSKRQKSDKQKTANSTRVLPMVNELQQNNSTCNDINQSMTASNPQRAIYTTVQPFIEATVTALLNDVDSNKRFSTEEERRKRRRIDDIQSPTLLTNKDTWNLPMHDGVQHSPMTANADTTIRTARQPVISPNNLYPGERQICKGFDNNQSYPPLLSRSESRDSGFGSPVLSALLTSNDFSTVYRPCTENQEFNPEIALVTSMNPEAVFIANGSCKICGTITRKKCLACYKEYYCGTECQTIHWPYHMKECTAR